MGLVQVSQPRGTAGTSVASLSFPLLGNIWYSKNAIEEKLAVTMQKDEVCFYLIPQTKLP